MNKYDQVIEWLCNHWITAVILLLGIVLISVPQLRDGVVIVWSWISALYRKGKRPDIDIVLKLDEETVTFTELLRSIQYDVIKVHAHTHVLGVAAEYEWIRQRYPKSETVQQALTTLDLITGKKKYKTDQIHFDVIIVKLSDGRKKEIYFDISDFFDGSGSSQFAPKTFIAKKIAHLYEIK
jgi:hypothetical protein